MAELEKQERTMVCKEAEEEKLLDFNSLCSKVAMQTNNYGNWRILNEEEGEGEGEGEYGVLRMWEGDLFDCCEDHRIALDSTWYFPNLMSLFSILFTISFVDF